MISNLSIDKCNYNMNFDKDRIDMERWPNFFIVGAPRAGTTSLHAYLKEIPGIYMSPVKEPNYFSRQLIPDNHPLLNPIRDQQKYLSLFDGVSNEKIIGEASPLYLSDLEAPKLIHEVSPNASILISLRDPIERALSHFTLVISDGGSTNTFHQELQDEFNFGLDDITKPHLFLLSGLYSESVKRYQQIFGTKNIKIIIFEEFIQNPKQTVKDVLDFLNINHSLSNFQGKAYNPFIAARGPTSEKILTSKDVSKFAKLFLPSATRKFLRRKILTKKQTKPTIEDEDRKILQEYYKENVEKLKKILKRDLPWSNF